MSTPYLNALEQQEDLPFCMPIQPSDYSDRSPTLEAEERKGIEYLLSLASAYYRTFEQQVASLARVTKPLQDVLVLYRQARPTSFLSHRHFILDFMDHVLRTNLLYWGWSREIWEKVIDTASRRPQGRTPEKGPGRVSIRNPNVTLMHLTAYLLADVIYLTGRSAFPARLLGEIIFGSQALARAMDNVRPPWLAAGYTSLKKTLNGKGGLTRGVA